ncbi:CGNR zinc finger domain-containing protein [Streptomyces sp. NPDC001588]|uniref:CGNR zinc finger domain-containing protein n=1 Tax=unclassified Streptomyces TaxID=2593676 RepID=UPI0033EFC922
MRSTNMTVPDAEDAGLTVTVALLLTALRAGDGDPDSDRLANLAAAQQWAARLDMEGLELTARDLTPLRRFRESLRDARLAGQSEQLSVAAVESSVNLSWTPDGVQVMPRGLGWRRIAAAVSVELLKAEAAGVLSRLKTCAHQPCGYPFIDASRNRSRAWHDTAKCGNIVNLRASRARRKPS